MIKTTLKCAAAVAALGLVVAVLIGQGVADSVVSFDWQTSERLLLGADDAKKAAPFSINISPRGTHVAYHVKEGTGSDERHHIWADGRETGAYDYVWEMIFSPDGKRSAFLVQKGPNAGASYFYVVDGKEHDKYESLRFNTAAFSPDGSLFGYVASRAKEQFIVINGVPGKPYELIWGLGRRSEAPLAFSANGKHYAYSAVQAKKTALVVDGKEYTVEWNLDKLPRLSNDGTRWGWVNLIRTESPGASVKLENQVIIDGSPSSKVYPEIANNPVFSPDGKRVAFGAKTSREFGAKAEGTGLIVVDGNELAPRYEFVRTIIFSPDGKRLAYEAKRRGKFVVVIDGQESKEYELVHPRSLVFSSDGRRLAYRITSGKEEFMVVDGVEQGPYTRILTPATFSPDGRHVAYLAVSGEQQFAVIDGIARTKYQEVTTPDPGTNAAGRSELLRLEFEPLEFVTRDSFGFVAKRDGAYYWIEERRLRHLLPAKK